MPERVREIPEPGSVFKVVRTTHIRLGADRFFLLKWTDGLLTLQQLPHLSSAVDAGVVGGAVANDWL